MQTITKTAMDLFYNPKIRRWVIRVLGTVFGVWLLLVLLGIEILVETTHIEGGTSCGRFGCFTTDESYNCRYWTGFGYRYQEISPYNFTACPVWRWGRQIPD